jgi:hypothetical protein
MTGPNGCYTKPFFNTGNVYGHFYGHNGQGSPYEPMPSSHPQHFDVISHLYLQICCADTKSMLSLSGPSLNAIFKAIIVTVSPSPQSQEETEEKLHAL